MIIIKVLTTHSLKNIDKCVQVCQYAHYTLFYPTVMHEMDFEKSSKHTIRALIVQDDVMLLILLPHQEKRCYICLLNSINRNNNNNNNNNYNNNNSRCQTYMQGVIVMTIITTLLIMKKILPRRQSMKPYSHSWASMSSIVPMSAVQVVQVINTVIMMMMMMMMYKRKINQRQRFRHSLAHDSRKRKHLFVWFVIAPDVVKSKLWLHHTNK